MAKDKHLKKQSALRGVSASVFLEEIHNEIKKYKIENSVLGIMTCDVDDVYNWLEKAEKKVIKKDITNGNCSVCGSDITKNSKT